MSENVKVAMISGAVSVLVAICGTIGVIYSQRSDLNEASSAARTAADEAKTLQAKVNSTTLPSGAVVAFRLADCPEGWEPYDLARGRAIIGSGKGDALSTRHLEEHGGEETVILTTDQLPAHKHKYAEYHYYDQAKKKDAYATPKGDETGDVVKKTRTSEAAGGGEAHNNMPPFVSLLYCRKT